VSRRQKAGHRVWAPKNGRVAGVHTGDIMPAATRSAVMSRIRGRDTTPERLIQEALRRVGIRFTTHVSTLPGRPDVVIAGWRIAIFVDGDFWHGWRFPLWRHKLSEAWQSKIAATRQRDQRNFGRCRRAGWHVIRIWEHEIEQDLSRCVSRICQLIASSRKTSRGR
jgi:DNA mismatch endonuclease (patch repair protein)